MDLAAENVALLLAVVLNIDALIVVSIQNVELSISEWVTSGNHSATRRIHIDCHGRHISAASIGLHEGLVQLMAERKVDCVSFAVGEDLVGITIRQNGFLTCGDSAGCRS